MRSRRSTQEEVAAVSRRRLELLSAELDGQRAATGEEPRPDRSPGQVGTVSLPPAAAEPAGRPSAAVEPAGRPSAATEPAGRPSAAAEPAHGRHARRPVAPAQRAGGWLHDRLPATLQGRVALRAGHLVVVAVLVAAAFAVTAWWVVRAEGTGTAVPMVAREETTSVPETDEPLVEPRVESGAQPEPAAASAPATVVVDVAGKVRRPGIVTLPPGSRVVDAIEEAGGARRGVNLTRLNLARVLADGEQVLVGIRAPGGVAAPAASARSAGSGAGPRTLVNINTAAETTLEELPGVGPVTAAAIVQWRTENGPFSAVDELMEVSGIGEATLADMAPFVTL